MKFLKFFPVFFLVSGASAQQAPWGQLDIAVSSRDRVYTADQTSNTVSVIDPFRNRLLGVISDPVPGALSPLYRGQLLVHGFGYSPDSKTLAVVSIEQNPQSQRCGWTSTCEPLVQQMDQGGIDRQIISNTPSPMSSHEEHHG